MYRLTVLRQNLPGAHSPSVDLEVGGESLKAYPIIGLDNMGDTFASRIV